VDCTRPDLTGNQGPIGITTTGIPLYNHWATPPPQGAEGKIYKYTKLPQRARQLYHLDPVFARTFDTMGGQQAIGKSVASIGAALAVDALQRMVRNHEHSGIVGYALDGYPIYGPVGYWYPLPLPLPPGRPLPLTRPFFFNLVCAGVALNGSLNSD